MRFISFILVLIDLSLLLDSFYSAEVPTLSLFTLTGESLRGN